MFDHVLAEVFSIDVLHLRHALSDQLRISGMRHRHAVEKRNVRVDFAVDKFSARRADLGVGFFRSFGFDQHNGLFHHRHGRALCD